MFEMKMTGICSKNQNQYLRSESLMGFFFGQMMKIGVSEILSSRKFLMWFSNIRNIVENKNDIK